MEDQEHLRRTLEHYRQLKQQKLDEARAFDPIISQLERDLGETPSGNTETANTQDQTDSISLRILPLVRPDEFYGMSQSDAARAYLKKTGHAIHFAHLVSALQRGGAKLGGADPQKTLYVSLARNPKKDFVWPSKDHIGLKEFYDRKS
jgi:hypothetical protein